MKGKNFPWILKAFLQAQSVLQDHLSDLGHEIIDSKTEENLDTAQMS